MPLYYLQCDLCSRQVKLLTTEPIRDEDAHLCPHACGGKLLRIPKAPTTQVVETFDNGLMAKTVERLKDIDEMMDERSNKDLKKVP